jgi:hypothetical protein
MALEPIITKIGQNLIVNLPVVNAAMVTKAFGLLSNGRITQCEENFILSTETVDHSDIEEYVASLSEQYKNADDNVKYFLQRAKLVKQGDQFASAIATGLRNQYSVSVIATCRRKDGTTDEHKILIASMRRSIEMSAAWNFFAQLFGIKSEEQKELERIVKQFSAEDGKRCIEALVVHALGDKIRSFLGDSVEVRFVEKK